MTGLVVREVLQFPYTSHKLLQQKVKSPFSDLNARWTLHDLLRRDSLRRSSRILGVVHTGDNYWADSVFESDTIPGR